MKKLNSKIQHIVNDKNFGDHYVYDDIKFSKDMTLLKYPSNKKDTEYKIPNGVKSIGINAFENCTSLTSIAIPNSVTSIGEGAFQYCESLQYVIIPESVTSIGNDAFNGCSSDLTIYGKAGSYAETYADDWGYNFEAI